MQLSTLFLLAHPFLWNTFALPTSTSSTSDLTANPDEISFPDASDSAVIFDDLKRSTISKRATSEYRLFKCWSPGGTATHLGNLTIFRNDITREDRMVPSGATTNGLNNLDFVVSIASKTQWLVYASNRILYKYIGGTGTYTAQDFIYTAQNQGETEDLFNYHATVDTKLAASNTLSSITMHEGKAVVTDGTFTFHTVRSEAHKTSAKPPADLEITVNGKMPGSGKIVQFSMGFHCDPDVTKVLPDLYQG